MAIKNDLKSGICKKIYGATAIPCYVDTIDDDASFPCFYISTNNDTHDLHIKIGKFSRYEREHDFVIRYFPTDEQTIHDQSAIDEMAEVLFDVLEYIPIPDGIIRGTQMHYAVSDGVLIFYVSYNFFVKHLGTPSEKMENLILKEGTNTNG